jgi:hypothetical protein
MEIGPEKERFLNSVAKSEDCWTWTGSVDRYGYGKFYFRGRYIGAHRFSYTLFVGPLPTGVPIDHTCHDRDCELGVDCMHRRCVNPNHLEASSVALNTQRGRAGTMSHAYYERSGKCRSGHPWIPDNIRPRRINGKTARVCVLCERKRTARYKAKVRAAAK